ncbi:MAG: helix-turn-helix domain-containing protein [Hyphomicrobiaceae bacterium]|nr:MAG: helix-turn-helix domain-containing protein [Hyphomicrobiaceae bacterium]
MARAYAEDWLEAAAQAGRTPEGTQSIHRAFLLLRVLAASGDTGLGLTEVSRATALTRPTAHRVLSALMAEGVVEQKSRTRRYVVGKHVQLAGLSPPLGSPLLSAAIPHLNEAVEEIGDTLFLTVRTGLETVCVARRLGSYPIQVLSLDVGVRRPLGVSSSGIAILASLRPDAARDLIVQNERHLRSYDMTVEDSLAAVAEARAAGYALREKGLVRGTRAVSVTLGHRNGEAPAALTVAAIARRLQPHRAAAIAERLKTYGARIEQSLQK